MTVTLSNPPCFFEVRIGETTILGKSLATGGQVGMHIRRHTADCVATLTDEYGGSLGLFFLQSGRPDPPQARANVVGDGQVSICLFARETDGSDYFVFQSDGAADWMPKVPPAAARIAETRDFVLRVHEIYGGRPKEFPLRMRRHMDGNLYLEHPNGQIFF